MHEPVALRFSSGDPPPLLRWPSFDDLCAFPPSQAQTVQTPCHLKELGRVIVIASFSTESTRLLVGEESNAYQNGRVDRLWEENRTMMLRKVLKLEFEKEPLKNREMEKPEESEEEVNFSILSSGRSRCRSSEIKSRALFAGG
ncbi:hypothetical protein SRHO_G00073750 [Serrasalmus rhombeus]